MTSLTIRQREVLAAMKEYDDSNSERGARLYREPGKTVYERTSGGWPWHTYSDQGTCIKNINANAANALLQRGLISKSLLNVINGGNRQYYVITPAGRAALEGAK
jgi:hypothetical protein